MNVIVINYKTYFKKGFIINVDNNHNILNSREFKEMASEMTSTVQSLSQKGWTPATSSNFSAKIPGFSDLIAISKSGADKSAFNNDHVMIIDKHGNPFAPKGCKPSAETLLHTMLFEDSRIGAVLHTHSSNGTVISMLYGKQGKIEFSGFEILKGIQGNKTHEMTELLPIFPNSQDMQCLAEKVRAYKEKFPETHGFLIEGHGLYSWGSCLAEAKRHIEVFEFLFECNLRSNT